MTLREIKISGGNGENLSIVDYCSKNLIAGLSVEKSTKSWKLLRISQHLVVSSWGHSNVSIFRILEH